MDYDFEEDRKYNKLYTFLLSIVPGAGHMYLGLMKKGLQFMFLFFGIIVITDLIYSARSFTILNIVIWFYAFFDAYHSRKKLEAEISVEEDLFSELKLNNANPKYVGVGLIALGAIVLFQQIVIEFLAIGVIVIPNYIKAAILDSIFPVLLVIIGILILRSAIKKSKRSQKDFDLEEDFDEDFDIED